MAETIFASSDGCQITSVFRAQEFRLEVIVPGAKYPAQLEVSEVERLAIALRAWLDDHGRPTRPQED